MAYNACRNGHPNDATSGLCTVCGEELPVDWDATAADFETEPAEGASLESLGAESPPKAHAKTMFCGECGEPVAGRFCTSCGTPVGAPLRPNGSIELGTVDTAGNLSISSRGLVISTLVVLVVVVAALAVRSLVTRSPSHTIAGTMTLYESSGGLNGAYCYGESGYDDIEDGAEVRVTDEDGTLIGSGNLESGRMDAGDCVFKFEVPDVKDTSYYSVEVSHRGGLSFSKSEMESNGWEVHATLG